MQYTPQKKERKKKKDGRQRISTVFIYIIYMNASTFRIKNEVSFPPVRDQFGCSIAPSVLY